MTRFQIYTIAGFLGILSSVIFADQETIVDLLTFIFILSTFAITFTFTSVKDSNEESKIETPVKYYQRKSAFNLENLSRAALLSISSIIYVNNPGKTWPVFLIIFWTIGILTAIIPDYYYSQLGKWGILEESIYQEFKPKIKKKEVRSIVYSLENGLSDKSIEEQFGLSAETTMKIRSLYNKMNRELAN